MLALARPAKTSEYEIRVAQKMFLMTKMRFKKGVYKRTPKIDRWLPIWAWRGRYRRTRISERVKSTTIAHRASGILILPVTSGR